MRRRDFVVGIVAVTWTFVARAQQPGRTYRIALLAPFVARDVWLDELKRNGFIEGANLRIDRGVSPIANLESVAAELVKESPDAIVTFGPTAGHAAQHATATIPIVAYTDDPVASGLVASLSKPGGNTTGVGILSAQLDAKRLEILHELVPSARRVGVLADPTQEVGLIGVKGVARDLGLDLVVREVRDVDGIVPGLDALAAAQVSAIHVLASAIFYGGKTLIIEHTRALGLPTMYWWADLVREGGLISFGLNIEDVDRLLGQQVVRV